MSEGPQEFLPAEEEPSMTPLEALAELAAAAKRRNNNTKEAS